MKKNVLIIIFQIICFVFLQSAQAADGKISLSIYYPPPHGEYDSVDAGDITVDKLSYTDGSRVIRKSVVLVTTNPHVAGTGWTHGPIFPAIHDFKAGSLIKLSYHIPMRNDSVSWGGGYIEPQISFNGGATWNSLGSSGFDGGVMQNTAPSIGSYFNSLLIDPQQSSSFSIMVRFFFRSYDGTVMINQSHDINNISGTATLMTGMNGIQHYAKIIVEELAL
jgi:hypothetical protein